MPSNTNHTSANGGAIGRPPVQITLTTDGGAYVGEQLVRPGEGLDLEHAVVREVARRALRAGGPLLAVVHDPDPDVDDAHLMIRPDGTSELALPPPVPAPVDVAAPAGAPAPPTSSNLRQDSQAGQDGQDGYGPAVGERREWRSSASLSSEELLQKVGPGERVTARAGLRGALASVTGLPVPPGRREADQRRDLLQAQAPLPGPCTVMVVNPKGGTHKTTSTLFLAAALAVARGGGVVAFDANETRGTMGWRSMTSQHGGTTRILLRDVPALTARHTQLGDLDRYVHYQGHARSHVLPSDDTPDMDAWIMSGDDFTQLHQVLRRFFRIIVVDTGNNMRAGNWRAAADAADLLVISSTVRRDTAASATWLLDALHNSGLGDLATGAVTLLHQAGPIRDRRLQSELDSHFAARTADVIHLPYEPTLVGGGQIDYEAISRAGTRAWQHAAASVAARLATIDPRPAGPVMEPDPGGSDAGPDAAPGAGAAAGPPSSPIGGPVTNPPTGRVTRRVIPEQASAPRGTA